ncbi:MAG: calcium-binding protein, partial [Pseudomonadota bacterium]
MADNTFVEGQVQDEFLSDTRIVRTVNDGLANGGFVVAIQQGRGTYSSVANAQQADAFVQIFDATGATVGAQITVSASASVNESGVDVAGLTGGGFVVSFNREAPGGQREIFFQRYDNAGNALGGQVQANTTALGVNVSSIDRNTEVIALANGGFMVAWTTAIDNGDTTSTTFLRAQRFDSSGNQVGSEILVNSETAGLFFSSPDIQYSEINAVELTGGNLAFTWSRFSLDGLERSAQIAVFDSAGTALSGVFRPEQTLDGPLSSAETILIALGNNTFMSVWTVITGANDPLDPAVQTVFGRLYNASGVALGNEFVIDNGPDNFRGGLFGEQDGNGGAIIGYAQEQREVDGISPIIIQNVDQTGTVQGDPIWLNRHLRTTEADLALLTNGDLVATLRESPSTAASFDTYNRFVLNGEDARIITGNETITLGNSGEVIAAGDGSATLTGGTGEDFIGGGPGQDNLSGGGGDDVLSGGDDNDTLNGDAGDDQLFGGAGVDTISGGNNNDVIDGESGADILNGGSGDDIIYGGTGGDTINGGAGEDTLLGFRADQDAPTSSFILPSSSPNEDIAGEQDAPNTISGGDNDDLIVASGGGDTLNGDDGNDRIIGGAGNDIITGGLGDDLQSGRDGDDIFIIGPNDLPAQAVGSLESIDGQDGTDTVRLEGGSGTILQSLVGLQVQNVELIDFATVGVGGDRTLVISAGSRLFFSIPTDNTIQTTLDIDGHDVAGSTETLIIEIRQTGVSGGPPADLSLINFTNWGGQGEKVHINLTAPNADSDLNGTVVDDIVTLGNLNDRFDAKAGDDEVDGGTGDDIIIGGPGADDLDGGGGDNDTVSYETSTVGVEVRLSDNFTSGGDATGDTIVNFENVTGGSGNDMLTGDDDENVIKGMAGTDTLNGGDGDDTLEGGAGGDVLNGGDDDDTASYAASSAAVTVNLGTNTFSGGDAQGDSQTSIENLTGSAHADTLTGNTGNNILTGLDGNDRLDGGDGRDSFFGGDGDDILVFNDGDGLFGQETFDGGTGHDTILLEGGSNNLVQGFQPHVLVDINAVTFGTIAPGADRTLFINADQIGAGLALDATITGLDLADSKEVFAVFLNAASAVDLSGFSFVDWGGQGEEVQINGDNDEETIRGSSTIDIIAASGGNDVVFGNGGTDTISGGGGNDVANGGDGADTLNGGADNDTLNGNVGNDTVNGQDGNDTLRGQNGTDELNGGEGDDTLEGGAGTDT